MLDLGEGDCGGVGEPLSRAHEAVSRLSEQCRFQVRARAKRAHHFCEQSEYILFTHAVSNARACITKLRRAHLLERVITVSNHADRDTLLFVRADFISSVPGVRVCGVLIYSHILNLASLAGTSGRSLRSSSTPSLPTRYK